MQVQVVSVYLPELLWTYDCALTRLCRPFPRTRVEVEVCYFPITISAEDKLLFAGEGLLDRQAVFSDKRHRQFSVSKLTKEPISFSKNLSVFSSRAVKEGIIIRANIVI